MYWCIILVTYMAVGVVQQVLDAASFDGAHLVAQRLFDDDIAALVSHQELVDVFC